jgi:hypothetical protein
VGSRAGLDAVVKELNFDLAFLHTSVYPKVSGLSRNEININNNKQSSRSNTKGYGGKTY